MVDIHPFSPLDFFFFGAQSSVHLCHYWVFFTAAEYLVWQQLLIINI